MKRFARTSAIAAGIAVLGTSCAQVVMPPGGPPDTVPPKLIAMTPDSGAVHAKPKEAVFHFDEVISEAPRGATDLTQLVIVSPSDGAPVVTWERTAIGVRPRHGWHPNTTYVVTLLPGVTDLRTNAFTATSVLVFSTGGEIPQTRITGAVFDWSKNLFAGHAYIEAHPQGDTTLKFATEADSVGRFVLPYLSPATYVVRAILDANHNHQLDARELWDSTTVTLRDSVSHDFYSFVHDTIGPRISGVSQPDSLTLRITFDQPLWADSTYLPTIEVRTADSTLVPGTRVADWASLNDAKTKAARAQADSTARADTSSARKLVRERAALDSINRAAVIADSIAHDTVKRVPPPPVSKRRQLATEVAVILAHPLAPGDRYPIEAIAKGVLGNERPSRRNFTVAKAVKPPPDAGAGIRKDTTAGKPPPPPRD